MRDAWLDLMLGSTCAGCGQPGRALCAGCRSELPRAATAAWPSPCPPGLARPVAAGEYDGLLKLLVNAHKEQRRFALARPLGQVLALAVLDVIRDGGGESRQQDWVLVPVPSRGAVVRARGHDPMLRVTRRAAVLLRGRGHRVSVTPLVRAKGRARDQAGLAAGERAENLAGTMHCRRSRSPGATARLVVTDDVITTGSTARETQRALQQAGFVVSGVAAVAATRRLFPS